MDSETGMAREEAGKAGAAAGVGSAGAWSMGGKVELVGLGTAEGGDRAGREGKNPATGENIASPATTVPAFKAGKALKDAIAK